MRLRMCPHCNEARLEMLQADEPFSELSFICPKCDSTYTLHELRQLDATKDSANTKLNDN